VYQSHGRNEAITSASACGRNHYGGYGDKAAHILLKENLLNTSPPAEPGALVAEIKRKLGIPEQAFYRWKKRLAGLGHEDLRRLRTLEELAAGQRAFSAM